MLHGDGNFDSKCLDQGITSAHFLSNFDSKNSTGAQSPDLEAHKNDSKISRAFSGSVPKDEVDIIKLIAKWHRAANFTPGKRVCFAIKISKALHL